MNVNDFTRLSRCVILGITTQARFGRLGWHLDPEESVPFF